MENLGAIEATVRQRVDVFKSTMSAFEQARCGLAEAVEQYLAERERLQRNAWESEGIGWCQLCHTFHPQESIDFLYTVGREWHGSHGYETHGRYRKVRSFCDNCAEILLSRPGGGEKEWQCFRARRENGTFVIFVSGEWKPLPDPEHAKIQIEKPSIDESEYDFGARINFRNYPRFKLTIGEEEVL